MCMCMRQVLWTVAEDQELERLVAEKKTWADITKEIGASFVLCCVSWWCVMLLLIMESILTYIKVFIGCACVFVYACSVFINVLR